ncbi:hypothetical protein BDV98DRAFT_345051 [Pterulicium gracile]|uniref:Uncharacterized protein n=1 Tax=Pterulicium gracile TaxID=1884261 RepID=A0A5C3Q472_9AGAR|nr:hypothetical protein BDV98DRAFT_345051 [Pterula gracilis]
MITRVNSVGMESDEASLVEFDQFLELVRMRERWQCTRDIPYGQGRDVMATRVVRYLFSTEIQQLDDAYAGSSKRVSRAGVHECRQFSHILTQYFGHTFLIFKLYVSLIVAMIEDSGPGLQDVDLDEIRSMFGDEVRRLDEEHRRIFEQHLVGQKSRVPKSICLAYILQWKRPLDKRTALTIQKKPLSHPKTSSSETVLRLCAW